MNRVALAAMDTHRAADRLVCQAALISTHAHKAGPATARAAQPQKTPSLPAPARNATSAAGRSAARAMMLRARDDMAGL